VKARDKYILAAVAALVLLPLIVSQSEPMTAAQLIASFEGFRAHPYWDVNRYSWGYGTPAPGATGTITKEQALAELQQHSAADLQYLQPLITRPLNANQWAALLSFAYNEGSGNADNLVNNINAGDDQALADQWRLYNKARDAAGNLVYSQTLADRREKELQTWFA